VNTGYANITSEQLTLMEKNFFLGIIEKLTDKWCSGKTYLLPYIERVPDDRHLEFIENLATHVL
jgi:hypothetical protein